LDFIPFIPFIPFTEAPPLIEEPRAWGGPFDATGLIAMGVGHGGAAFRGKS